MARFVLVAMMMFAAVNAQIACDMDAFSAIMQKVSTDCISEARCSAACQGDINAILNTPAITACFEGQESSLQLLERYKSECTCNTFNAAMSSWDHVCTPYTMCSSACQGVVRQILNATDVEECFSLMPDAGDRPTLPEIEHLKTTCSGCDGDTFDAAMASWNFVCEARDVCSPVCQGVIDLILNATEIAKCFSVIPHKDSRPTLLELEQFKTRCSGCNVNRFEAAMTSWSFACEVEPVCNSACQGVVDLILNTAEIERCFSALPEGGRPSLRALEQYRTTCSGCDAGAFDAAVAAWAFECEAHDVCSPSCQNTIDLILNTANIENCFSMMPDSRPTLLELQQYKTTCSGCNAGARDAAQSEHDRAGCASPSLSSACDISFAIAIAAAAGMCMSLF
jgi:hypothetical protein